MDVVAQRRVLRLQQVNSVLLQDLIRLVRLVGQVASVQVGRFVVLVLFAPHRLQKLLVQVVALTWNVFLMPVQGLVVNSGLPCAFICECVSGIVCQKFAGNQMCA